MGGLRELISVPELKFSVRFFNLIGVWPLSERCQVMYFIWTGLLHSLLTAAYLLSMVMKLITDFDLNDLYITLTEFAMAGKLINCLINYRRMQGVLKNLMDADIFQVAQLSETETIRGRLKHYGRIATAYKYMSLAAALSALVRSLVSDPPKMSFPAWYPFGLNNLCVTRNFYVVLLYQNTGMLMHCLMNITWDNFLMYLLINIQMQLHLIATRFRDYSETTNKQIQNGDLTRLFEHYTEIIR